MDKVSFSAELKNTIKLLEAEHKIKGQLLKKQVYLTYGSLRPANLLETMLKDISSSPYLIDNLLGTATGLTTGYLVKKIVVGTSGNAAKKLLGTILQFGLTNLFVKKHGTVRSLSQFIFQHFKKRIFKSCDC